MKNKKNIPKLRFLEFTDEWEMKMLGEIGKIVNGLTYSPDDIDKNGILVLRSSNIKNGQLVFEDNVFVKTTNYNPVKENDILICVRNGSKNLIGKSALIDKENESLVFGAFISVYRSQFNRFLFQWFNTEEFKKNIYKDLVAVINSINGNDLKKMKIPFPTLHEQHRIASFLSLLDKKIELEKKRLKNLEQQKKYLLQQMFV